MVEAQEKKAVQSQNAIVDQAAYELDSFRQFYNPDPGNLKQSL